MFEDIGKPNLTNLLVLGAVGVILPRLLPEMRPVVGTAVKLVIDLLTESEAEAAEELLEALVSGTIAEIKTQIAGADDPEEGRRSAERSIAQFKHKAHRRAHRWGRDDVDRRRRYRRHLRRLREEMAQAQLSHIDWQRDIFDDLGEAIEDEAD
jgi:GrpB-like predicted nucleotidyltransferase (UPF0157 family)